MGNTKLRSYLRKELEYLESIGVDPTKSGVQIIKRNAVGSYREGVLIAYDDRTDKNAIVGFDAALGTYFLQAFENKAGDHLEIWLGTKPFEYPTIDNLMINAEMSGLRA